jgi:hypothetical protein
MVFCKLKSSIFSISMSFPRIYHLMVKLGHFEVPYEIWQEIEQKR